MAYLPERSCLAEGPAILGIGFRLRVLGERRFPGLVGRVFWAILSLRFLVAILFPRSFVVTQPSTDRLNLVTHPVLGRGRRAFFGEFFSPFLFFLFLCPES